MMDTSWRWQSREATTRMSGWYAATTSFVRLKASSYFLIGGDADDLVQEGLVGLYKAIRDYRTDRESSFRNFAELCITRQIITAVKTSTRNKHTPLNGYVSFSSAPAGATENEPTLDEMLPGSSVHDPHSGDLLGSPAPCADVTDVHHQCRSWATRGPTPRRSCSPIVTCSTFVSSGALDPVVRTPHRQLPPHVRLRLQRLLALAQRQDVQGAARPARETNTDVVVALTSLMLKGRKKCFGPFRKRFARGHHRPKVATAPRLQAKPPMHRP